MDNEEVLAANDPSAGVYVCANCDAALFRSNTRFEAGCGFPSFWKHIDQQVKFNPLDTYGRHRIQLLCNSCGMHLGHLFDNKFTPTKVRYCISHVAIKLISTG